MDTLMQHDPQWIIDYLGACRQYFAQPMPRLPWRSKHERDLQTQAAYNRAWRERNRDRFNSWSRAYAAGYTVQKGKTI